MENDNLETAQDTSSTETVETPSSETSEAGLETPTKMENGHLSDEAGSETHGDNHQVEEIPVKRKEFREDGVRTSSIFPSPKEDVEIVQNKMSTPFLLIFLVLVFFILKTFIYKKDDKRHGK